MTLLFPFKTISTPKTHSCGVSVCVGEKKVYLTEVSVCLFGDRGHENAREPRASTCADICLKLSLLSSPAVPHFICSSALGFHADDEGPRLSAMRCSSETSYLFFWTLGKLWTEVWLPWEGDGMTKGKSLFFKVVCLLVISYFGFE